MYADDEEVQTESYIYNDVAKFQFPMKVLQVLLREQTIY